MLPESEKQDSFYAEAESMAMPSSVNHVEDGKATHDLGVGWGDAQAEERRCQLAGFSCQR